MRYLAIDYGIKRTGLAACDESEMIATPMGVLEGQKKLVSDIAEIIEQEGIEAVLFGLPLNMDGTEGRQTRIVRKFAEKLGKVIELPIHFHDERLSSFEAGRKLSGLSLTRKKKKKLIDSVAAAKILQSFLDNKNTL